MKCEQIGEQFEHFTCNEWIFENKSQLILLRQMSKEDRELFNFDVMRIKWKIFIMNHAYGIKRFILKEEAEIPSLGYNDIITYMAAQHGENYLPWYSRGQPLKVRTNDEMKQLILESEDVRKAIA